MVVEALYHIRICSVWCCRERFVGISRYDQKKWHMPFDSWPWANSKNIQGRLTRSSTHYLISGSVLRKVTQHSSPKCHFMLKRHDIRYSIANIELISTMRRSAWQDRWKIVSFLDLSAWSHLARLFRGSHRAKMTWNMPFDSWHWAGSKNVQGCVHKAWNTYVKCIARSHFYFKFKHKDKWSQVRYSDRRSEYEVKWQAVWWPFTLEDNDLAEWPAPRIYDFEL